jgi:hypothetical protein
VLGDLFYQLGAAVGGLGAHLPGKGGAGFGDSQRDVGVYDVETDEVLEIETGDPFGQAGGLMAGTAAAWLASRVLRPRAVSWPRVVIAGVAATFFVDLLRRRMDAEGPAGDEDSRNDPEALARRYAAGIAMAAGYASLLYPRLPGPPLLRGLAFGALDLAAAQRGGLAGLAADAPTLRFPLQALAAPVEDREAGPLGPMAFGLALGLFYRHDPEDEEDDLLDEDE